MVVVLGLVIMVVLSVCVGGDGNGGGIFSFGVFADFCPASGVVGRVGLGSVVLVCSVGVPVGPALVGVGGHCVGVCLAGFLLSLLACAASGPVVSR